jgi:hypothetical protein
MYCFRPSTSEVVFVRYTNDIAELEEKFRAVGFTVKTYEKHPENKYKPYFVPYNKGNEASGYLKYIIDHYGDLPEHVVFLHDHEYSWHHKGSILPLVVEHIGKRVRYKNLNSFIWSNETIEWFPELLDWYDHYFVKELGCIQQYGDFMSGFQGCAQFIVHKDIIRQRSLQFYMNLYTWLLSTDMDDYYSGRHLEYTWHLMWGQVSKHNHFKQHTVNFFRRLFRLPILNKHILDSIAAHVEKKKKTYE